MACVLVNPGDLFPSHLDHVDYVDRCLATSCVTSASGDLRSSLEQELSKTLASDPLHTDDEYSAHSVRHQEKLHDITHLHEDNNNDNGNDNNQKTYECRICLEDDIEDKLCMPCDCSGSQAYAHYFCIQNWIMHDLNQTDDITKCEICQAPWKITFKLRPTQSPAKSYGSPSSYYYNHEISSNWGLNQNRQHSEPLRRSLLYRSSSASATAAPAANHNRWIVGPDANESSKRLLNSCYTRILEGKELPGDLDILLHLGPRLEGPWTEWLQQRSAVTYQMVPKPAKTKKLSSTKRLKKGVKKFIKCILEI